MSLRGVVVQDFVRAAWVDRTEGKNQKAVKKKESSRETNGLAMRIRSTNSEKEAEALVKTKNITLLRQEIVWYHYHHQKKERKSSMVAGR